MSKVSRFPNAMAVAVALIAAPSAASAFQFLCEPDTASGTAVVEGTVIDTATSFPLQGAELTLTWVAGGRTVKREARTIRTGEFRFCSLPAGSQVSIQAKWFDRRSETQNLTALGRTSGVVLGLSSPMVVVTGHVTQQESGGPLMGAAVRMGPGTQRLTNEDGAFRFDSIPPGLWDVNVERLGFATVHDSVDIEFGTLPDLSIQLSVQAIALEAIRVTVRSVRLQQSGFYVRQGRGIGTHITRQQIDAQHSLASSDLLRRVPGLRLVRNRAGDYIAIGRGNCPYRFIIDGTRIGAGFSIDEMPPHWLEGIEVYHGVSQTPIEFSAGAVEANASCGVIVLWTRIRV